MLGEHHNSMHNCTDKSSSGSCQDQHDFRPPGASCHVGFASRWGCRLDPREQVDAFVGERSPQEQLSGALTVAG